MALIWLSKEEINEFINHKFCQADIVLDIGSGICPQTYVKPWIHICVEPYLPYIEKIRQDAENEQKYVFLNCTWDKAMEILPDRSIDSVFALDVIEHMEKEDGLKFLKEAERVARKQVVIYTPLGFYPQSYEDPNKTDRWEMGGGYWQTHRSGWYPEDFGEGWELICCKDYHFLDENNQPFETPFGIIWAFRNFTGNSSQIKQSLSLKEVKANELAIELWTRLTSKLKRVLMPKDTN